MLHILFLQVDVEALLVQEDYPTLHRMVLINNISKCYSSLPFVFFLKMESTN
jgi:hypothetical protein